MPAIRPPTLSPEALRRSMRLSVAEGLLYAAMVGFGDAYFLADAVRLGASALEQGLVITLPLFGGALGSVGAVRLLARRFSRKRVVLAGVGLQIAALGTLVALHLLPGLTAHALIGLAVLHQVGGQCAGTAWSSWYGDLVPAEIRGRYFARRSRWVYVVTCSSLVGSGLLLQALEAGAPGVVPAGAGGLGFCVAFGIAAAARCASAVLLLLSPEPAFRGLPSGSWTRRFLRTSRGRAAGRLLLVGAALQFCVYLGSPYFGPRMLEDLHFTYAEYMAASVAVVAAKILVLPLWGREVDAHGARAVYALAAVLVALVPLPWIFAQGLGLVLVAQVFSGISWGAYEVSFFALTLEATYKVTRPYLFAAQNVLQGGAQLLGGLVGAALLGLTGRQILLLFAVSLAARFVLAAAVPRLLPRLVFQQEVRRRDLLLRVIGFRPHGGIVHRPMSPSERREP